MSELTRKFEQSSETGEQRSGETAEPRAETHKEREQREHEKFWKDLEGQNPDDYIRHWTPERRKSYLEEVTEFLVDVAGGGVDTIVFMDKSARPLALILRMIWRRIYPTEQPLEMRFAVGKKIDEVTGEKSHFIDQIKRLYRKEDFENKKVLFIDEEIVSGSTLKGTSSVFKEVFPNMEVVFGAFSISAGDTSSDLLTIQPPKGSYYAALLKQEACCNLAKVIHQSKFYYRQTEVEESPYHIVAKARKMPRKNKWTYRLMLVGKHETLDEKSLKGIDERIAKAENEKERERLRNIKEAYSKLTT